MSRNIQDALVSPSAFAMGAASASTTSAAIDLGADEYKGENYEFELSTPALATGVIPDASVLTHTLETSTTSNFAAIVGTYSQSITGAGGAGVAAKVTRFSVPSDCPRYVRFKTTRGSGGTSAAAFNATGTVRF